MISFQRVLTVFKKDIAWAWSSKKEFLSLLSLPFFILVIKGALIFKGWESSMSFMENFEDIAKNRFSESHTVCLISFLLFLCSTPIGYMISKEKEEKTLMALSVTSLRQAEYILGKFLFNLISGLLFFLIIVLLSQRFYLLHPLVIFNLIIFFGTLCFFGFIVGLFFENHKKQGPFLFVLVMSQISLYMISAWHPYIPYSPLYHIVELLKNTDISFWKILYHSGFNFFYFVITFVVSFKYGRFYFSNYFKSWSPWILILILSLGLSFGTSGLLSKVVNKKAGEIPSRREFPTDSKISACEDFFQYTCGPVIRRFHLREDRSSHIFSYSDLSEKLFEIKKTYLKSLTTQKSFNERIQQIHDSYVACMNREARKIEEKEVIEKQRDEIMGLKTKKDFINYLVDKALVGLSFHVDFGKILNLDNSNIYDFVIAPGKWSAFPRKSYYENKKLMKRYSFLITEFFKLIEVDRPEQRAQWIIEIEKDFINNYPEPAEFRFLGSRRAYSSKAQLLKYKNLQLKRILEKVPDTIRIRNPMDKELSFLNKAVDRYSLDQLKSIRLLALGGYISESYPDYVHQGFKFSRDFLGGPRKRPSLEERCTSVSMGRFGREIDFELFDRFFKDFQKEKFVNLLEQVRSSIIEGLEKNQWLTEKSKLNAIRKIKMIGLKLIKPGTEKQWDFNPVLQYDTEKHIHNSKIRSAMFLEREFKRLVQPVDKDVWISPPLSVNAFYNHRTNKITVPAGILKYPFYDPNIPEWFNLGAIGSIIGHELGHAIDDKGSKYDEKGKLHQWMSQEDINTFKTRSGALAYQFYLADHDGQLTLGENISDLVGLTFALNAAKKQMPQNPEARDQAMKEFFLSYARLWCGIIRPKFAEQLLKTDKHASIQARVNEQMKHQADFVKVYKCKEGDKLFLPESERITIW